jgi:predicted ATPase/DNA-binding winged helix-turn-helix (wHTH) protein
LSSVLRFGRFEVRPSERRLLVEGAPVSLGSRAFDLLLALIDRRDRVVGKSELLDLVWPGLVVEENNLQVQVTTLRKLLGPEAITTVPGRGYRFTLTLRSVEPELPLSSRPSDALPRPLTSFVGREAELEVITGLLGTSRLLSLTGIGGGGKTRLAIELGRRVAQMHPDRVRFADLVPVTSPDRLAPEVARAAGVIEEPNRAIEETLVTQLARKRLLLILDNCEHLLDACAGLVERLLTGSEHLQVVATSREALGVSGEQIFAVRPLSVPAPGGRIEAALASEAVQLFINRGRLVLPEFALRAQNVAAVIETCRRLDGIPLAIELAAARLRVLSVEQIRDKLDDRFRLLATGSGTMSRHQTLQATLQWSYEHLTPDEQSLLRRASVFMGGWTLEAAIAVASQGESEIDLLDRLERLIDKSLFTVDRNSEGLTRYAMLETVRQYAHERLEESSEAAATHDAHLAYFLRVAADAQAQLPTQFVGALARIDSEIANLLAAHAWCNQPHVSPERGLELVTKLRRYWIERGRFALGRQVYLEALQRPGADRPTMQRAEAFFSLGQTLYFGGRPSEALAPLADALALAREHKDRTLTLQCLDKLAASHLTAGRLQEARAFIDEEITMVRATGAPHEICGALACLEVVCRFEGRLDEAGVAFEEAIRLLPQSDVSFANILTLNGARLAILQGQLAAAHKLLLECVRGLPKLDLPFHSQQGLEVAAHLAGACGEWTRAARIQGAASAAADRNGAVRNAWDDPLLAKAREKAREVLGDAAYEAAWKSGYAMEFASALDEVLSWLNTSAG